MSTGTNRTGSSKEKIIAHFEAQGARVRQTRKGLMIHTGQGSASTHWSILQGNDGPRSKKNFDALCRRIGLTPWRSRG